MAGLAASLTGVSEYLSKSAAERERERKEREAMQMISNYRLGGRTPEIGIEGFTEKLPLGGMQRQAQDTRAMAAGDVARKPNLGDFGPGTEMGQTTAGKEFFRSKTLSSGDVTDPQTIYNALVDAGMTDEAAAYASKVTSGGKSSSVEAQKAAFDTPENRKKVLTAIDSQEAAGLDPEVAELMRQRVDFGGAMVYDAMKDLGMISKGVESRRWGQKAQIPGKIEEEERMRPGKVKTAAATSAASEWAKLAPKEALLELTQKNKLAEKTGQQVVNMSKVESLMGNMWQRKKEQLAEPVGGLTGAGPVVGTIKKGAAKLRLPGGVSTGTFEGQKNETAAALNNVLTGQNRVIESIYNRIVATLPDELDTEEYAKAKIEQTLRNSFGLTKAMKMNGMLEPGYLQNISDEELADAQSEFNQKVSYMAPAPLDEADESNIRTMINRVLGVDSPYYKSTTTKKSRPTGSTAKDDDPLGIR